MKKIFITGGGGYVGTRLIPYLLKKKVTPYFKACIEMLALCKIIMLIQSVAYVKKESNCLAGDVQYHNSFLKIS